MGFLDNVKDAFRDAISPQASKNEVARKDAEATKDDAVVDQAEDSTAADEPVAPAPPTVDPVQPADTVKFETYTVKTGDSLPEIGARYGVSHLEIAKLNNIENPDLIFPGQVFRIPKN